MRSLRRRGSAATGSSAERRRSFRFAVALAVALTALLATGVSAFAGTSDGPNGAGFVTQADTTPLGYSSSSAAAADFGAVSNDGLGVPTGAIKHVWVITLENHAFESNFTGLNDNSYTASQLPALGALLTNYYGTGHSSLDNYISEMSGQAPVTDDQDDCASNSTSGGISDGYTQMGTGAAGTDSGLDTTTTSSDYGQYVSAAGPDAPPGDNGCVYPSTIPTFFNQLDAAKVSWKVYAQDFDLTGVYGQNAGASVCGAPDSTAGPNNNGSNYSASTPPDGSTSPYYVQGGAAAAGTAIGGPSASTTKLTVADQYVAKHNPLPWFDSVLNSGDCNSSHIAPLFGPNDALASDLQSESSTPSFNFIVPNNCSNGHDSVCAGNNLSGGFSGQVPNSPINNVGGSYATDQFLGHIVPEIMNSQAYQDGGLIVINWDEAYPQFTYSSDSFADSATTTASAYSSLNDDSAGETLYGRSLNWEPSGPNVPNITSATGQQVASGPGFDEYLDRPTSSTATGSQVACTTSPTASSTLVVNATTTNSNGYIQLPSDTCYSGGSNYPGPPASVTAGSISASGLVTQTASGAATSGGYSGLVSPLAEGDTVTLSGAGGLTTNDTNTPFYIGQVTQSNPPAAITSTGTDTTGADQAGTVQFQIVDSTGAPVQLSGGAGALVAPTSGMPNTGSYLKLGSESASQDPLYDAVDGTTGGGDTGAILISPFIKKGTVSQTYYNHYSLLRSLEDIFAVAKGGGTSAQTGYTGSINVSTGVDGLGHIGFAAQPGLAPFGTDVFTNSPLDDTATVTSTQTNTVTNVVTKTVAGTSKTTLKLESIVPKVTGLGPASAKSILGYAGFTYLVKGSTKAKKGYEIIVKSQSLARGKEELRGTKITLTLEYKKLPTKK